MATLELAAAVDAVRDAVAAGEHLTPDLAMVLKGLIEQAPPPDELVIPLRKPIELGSVTYTEIRLREPTAGEMKTWDKLGGADADIQAVSVVAGVPKIVAEKLGARDILTAGRYIARFFD